MAADSSTHALNIEEGNSPSMSKNESTIQIDLPSSMVNEKSQTYHGDIPFLSYRLSSASFLAKTVWLFTLSEHKTIVYPWTAFGIFSALSGQAITTNSSPYFPAIIGRLPHTLLWMWLNMVIFTIANQRLPNSVVEDAVNKPWRPMPSGRIDIPQARRLLLAAIPIALIISRFLGGFEPMVAAMVLTWMYNDLGGADESYIVRNVLNSLGLVCYSAGSMMVASGNDHSLNPMAYTWLAMEGAIVFTTLQVQDLRDQEGDRARGRGTAPLTLGDCFTRWSVAVPVMAWSLICPAFWSLGVYGFVMPVICGSIVAVRVLVIRSPEADEVTWKLWSLWMSSLYFLPLCTDLSVLYRWLF